MKILITGGAGFIGFHLAKQLAADGDTVHMLDNFARGRRDADVEKLCEQPNVSLVEADLTNKEQVLALDSDYDVIYHFAAINGTENFYNIPDKVLQVGVLGMLNILEWYSQHKHGRLIVASSSEAYAGALRLMGDDFPLPTPENVPLVVDDPSNVRWSYGASKIVSEVAMYCYAKARGIDDFTIIRFHNVYGPRMGKEHVIPQFIERIVKGVDPFPIFGGDETRTFCYITDAVDALKLIAASHDAKGETIHIGRSDEEVTIKELAQSLMDVAAVTPAFDIKPAPAGCVKRRCPNVDKLLKLGYTPKVSLTEGLKQMYSWYKPFYQNE